MRCFLLQLVLVAGLRLTSQTTSPVEKVVQLIEELKSKIEADGANEQKIYNKFACWCEATSARTADSIDAAKAKIGVTTTNILTLKGDIAVLESEIADAEASKAAQNDSIKKFTALRERENGDYQANKAYQETTLSSLHQAIGVLNGAGTGSAGFMEMSKAASTVRTALLGSTHLSMLSDSKARVMKTFLEEGKASYAPQSATVMGILKDMYDTFAADLESANKEESHRQQIFEALISTKEAGIKAEKAIVTSSNTQKAAKQEELAAAEELLLSTQEQLHSDNELFASVKDQCKKKSDSWDERGRLRTEELTGINKALEILTSDAARKTFISATGTRPQDTFGSEGVDVAFLQLDMEHSPQGKAYRAMKKVIGKTHRMSFARLAVAIRTATKGHFEEVMGAIDNMEGTLKDENKEDTESKDWCIETRDHERDHRDDQTYEIKQINNKIERKEVQKAKLEKDLAATRKAIVDLADSMTAANEDRTAENLAYVAAKADDETAVGLLQDAIAAMSNYGNNNAPALLQKEPVFERSEDQAPDTEFSDGGSHDGATGGIVALLTQIKENLENEVALANKAEAKAVEDIATLTETAAKQDEAYDLQETQLVQAIANADEEIGDKEDDEEDENDARDDTKAYLSSIKPKCDFIEGAFTDRIATRKAESEGLQQAKAILAGSEGGDFGFLQKA